MLSAVQLSETVIEPGETYYWQLTANGPGGSTPGAVQSITTIDPALPCPTDLSGDGVTDLADLLQVLGAFGATADGDTNGDNVTDLADLLAVLGAFGSACP